MMNMLRAHRHSEAPPAISRQWQIIAALKDMQGGALHFISVTASTQIYYQRDDGSFGRLYPKWLWDSTIVIASHSIGPKNKVAETIGWFGQGCVCAFGSSWRYHLWCWATKDLRLTLIEFINEQAPHLKLLVLVIQKDTWFAKPNLRYSKISRKVDAGCSKPCHSQLFFWTTSVSTISKTKCTFGWMMFPFMRVSAILNRKSKRLLLEKTCENIRLSLPRKLSAGPWPQNDPGVTRVAGLAPCRRPNLRDLVTHGRRAFYTMNNADTAQYIHQATHALFNHQL